MPRSALITSSVGARAFSRWLFLADTVLTDSTASANAAVCAHVSLIGEQSARTSRIGKLRARTRRAVANQLNEQSARTGRAVT